MLAEMESQTLQVHSVNYVIVQKLYSQTNKL